MNGRLIGACLGCRNLLPDDFYDLFGGFHKCWYPKMDGLYIMENPIEKDDFGAPLFQEETSIFSCFCGSTRKKHRIWCWSANKCCSCEVQQKCGEEPGWVHGVIYSTHGSTKNGMSAKQSDRDVRLECSCNLVKLHDMDWTQNGVAAEAGLQATSRRNGLDRCL